MAKESDIQRKVMGRLNRAGAFVVKTVVSNRAGVPDILACVPTIVTQEMVGKCVGLFHAVEVKKPGEEPTPMQLFKMEKIKKAGGKAEVACE